MRVKDLILKLQNMDPELSVHFAFPSGDYWRTTKAREVKDVRPTRLEWSGYHDSWALQHDEDDRENDPYEGKEKTLVAIVLR